MAELERYSPLARLYQAMGYKSAKPFADAVGVSVSTIHKWAEGLVDPSPEAAKKAATVLEMTVDEFCQLLEDCIKYKAKKAEYLKNPPPKPEPEPRINTYKPGKRGKPKTILFSQATPEQIEEHYRRLPLREEGCRKRKALRERKKQQQQESVA